MNLALPPTHRRAFVRSFWFIISWLVAVGVAGCALVVGSRWFLLVGLLSWMLLVPFVYFYERFVWAIYEGWNTRLVVPFATLSQRLVTRLCYYTVFVPLRPAGARLVLEANDRNTLWTMPGSAGATRSRMRGRTQWLGDYVAWSMRSGNTWALALLPFLAVLRLCTVPQQKRVPTDIYTLF